MAGDALRLAVGTLTVLPVAPPRSLDGARPGVAMVLAPVAVLPLAVVTGAAVWLGDALQAPPLLTAAVAVSLLGLGSGGLHLDGLADTADGLSVPGDRERRLTVMRTGDVGPVGAATLVLVLLVQVAALAGVVSAYGGRAALTAGLAVVVSRASLAAACVRGVPAARAGGLGSAVAGAVPRTAAVGVVAVVGAAAVLVDGGHGVVGVVLAAALAGVVLHRARARVGGVTGDVLGACVELALAGYLVGQVVTLPGG
ncbi:adenosylcobinamide-GDP ribazoletransferase [Nocardioides coralli]|nr:adenosylcobinamide-GDP ribazoletransferase [Nocardioides coralli]